MPKTYKAIPLVVTTTGSAGSASGGAMEPIPGGFGRVVAVDVDFHASAPATTDVTLTAAGRTILAVTNSATDKTYYPRHAVQTSAGADIASRNEEAPVAFDDLTVAVVQSNALDPAVTVTVILEI